MYTFNKIKYFLLFLFALSNVSATQFEIRVLVKDIKEIPYMLKKINAEHRGSYSFTDFIYFPVSKNTKISYARIRKYKQTNWSQKNIVVSIKTLRENYNSENTVCKKEYDHLENAKRFLEKDFEYQFSFFRTGNEYAFENMNIFVENIEHVGPSIEIIGKTKESIFYFLDKLCPYSITQESVPSIVEKAVFGSK